MSLTLFSPPAVEPVTLDALKAHLRVTHDAEDALIAGFGVAARQVIEARYGLGLIAQSWRLALDGQPSDTLTLPIAPVSAVQQVSVNLADGGEVIVEPDAYAVQTGPVGRIRFEAPLLTRERFGALVIVFQAGWPDAEAVPAGIRLAVKMLAAHFYENREGAGVERFFTTPDSVGVLMTPWRRVRL